MNIVVDESKNTSRHLSLASALTRQQIERSNYLKGSFPENSEELVRLLDARGKNSWVMVDRKINLINQASHETQHYHDMIIDSVEIDKVYDISDITSMIAEIRRDLSLPAYFTRVERNCLADFMNLFLVDDVYRDCRVDADGRKQFIEFVGYKPTFKLKPEE